MNTHSFQIGFSESPKCLCEHQNENSLHYITECWLYTEERRILYDQVEQNFIPNFKKLSKKRQCEILIFGYEINNKELLQINTKLMVLTQQYILKTKRFTKQINK